MLPSQKFVAALRLSKHNQYEIAWAAGINPTTLSKLVNGIERLHDDDKRIIAVGKVLGLPAAECFEEGELEGNRMPAKGCPA